MNHKTRRSRLRMALLALPALAPFAGALAMTGPQAKPAAEQEREFESKVRPILHRFCVPCHGDEKQSGGLRLDSRAGLKAGGKDGPVIAEADFGASRMLLAIRREGPLKMPPGEPLPQREMAVLEAWIKQGAPWPETAAKPATEFKIGPEAFRFWSFVKPRAVPPPTVKASKWVRNEIDRFLLARLEAAGLAPAPEADRRTLIRRASFDLLGLPPTPERVEAFVLDKRPNAWELLIDELLARPEYGERWGRHWLDVARYADSNGLDENVAFANAWRYRDYVIDSLNKDKPYDLFIQEQIAGDLMPAEHDAIRNERIVATGFLSIGAKVLAEPDKEKMVMDIVDEQIEVTSKAVMGLTISCARCHDHKFDPFSTKDYYALAGIFKSTKSMQSLATVAMWHERPLKNADIEVMRAEHQKEIDKAQKLYDERVAIANGILRQVLSAMGARAAEAAWVFSRQHVPTSVAEMPEPASGPRRIVIEAEKFARAKDVRADFEIYGRGIGVIYNTGSKDEVEWEADLPQAGPYQIEMRYAAAESRPVRLFVNGKLLRDAAAGAVTGSWQPDGQKWEVQGVVALPKGKTILRIERDGPIPHFDKLLLAPATGSAGGVVKTAEEIGSDYGVPAEFVTLLAGRVKDYPSAAEAAAAAEREPNRLLALPEKPERFYAPADREAIRKAAELVENLKKALPPLPMAMCVEDGRVEDCRVHLRGDTQTLGDRVPRRFPVVLGGEREAALGKEQSGRLELAKWMTRPDHPLTGRVLVNRVWTQHFGQGLMRTPDNWGFLGEKPTHPELLDWLAITFTAPSIGQKPGCGWSLKRLHRLIMTSSAYRMSTRGNSVAEAKDPQNRLWWRFNRRRLEAEPFRDSLLFLAGRLEETRGGSLLKTPNHGYVTNDQSGNAATYDSPRRTIYLPVIRNAVFDYLQSFDFGDPTMVNVQRFSTTVAPQALWVMNSAFANDMAASFAERIEKQEGTDEQRVDWAHRAAFGRPAASGEIAKAMRFLASAEQVAEDATPALKRRAAWTAYAQALLASNEFIYVN